MRPKFLVLPTKPAEQRLCFLLSQCESRLQLLLRPALTCTHLPNKIHKHVQMKLSYSKLACIISRIPPAIYHLNEPLSSQHSSTMQVACAHSKEPALVLNTQPSSHAKSAQSPNAIRLDVYLLDVPSCLFHTMPNSPTETCLCSRNKTNITTF